MLVTPSALFASAALLASAGQGPTAQQPPVVQETVQVVATKLPEAPHEVPESIEVFTGEDLRRLGATSLGQALSLASGVAVAPGGDGGPASAVPEFWGLREMDAFLLVVDDVPWGGAFNPALASVSLRDVDRIEVLRGAAPVTYGATSFVGVIHVVHQPAAAERSYVSGSGASHSSGSFAADLAIPVHRGWTSRLSAEFERQGFRDERTAFVRGHTLFRAGTAHDGNRTWFSADVTVLRQDPASPRPRQGAALSPLVPVDANHNPAGSFMDEDRIAVAFGTDRALGSGRRLAATASLTQSREDRFRGFLRTVANVPQNAVGLRQKIDVTDLYADTHLTLRADAPLRFVVGGDLLHGRGDSRGATFGYAAPLAGAPAPGVTRPRDLPLAVEARRDFLGAYTLAEWRLAKRLSVSAGLRANVTVEERGDEGGDARAQDVAVEQDDAQTHVRPSGSVGALYTVWENRINHVRLFGNYRNTFKPAAFDFGLGEEEAEGDALLEPEKAGSVEGGVKVRALEGRVDLEASLFRLDFTNLVTPTIVGGLPALVNAGKTRFQGVEIASDLRLCSAVGGRIAYSFHDATFVDVERSFDGGPPTQLAGKRFEMSPRHLLTAGVFLAPRSGLVGDLVVKHTGDRYLDKRNRALAEPFTTIDAGAGYRFERYEVRLDGRNLTDVRDPVAESELGDAQYYLMPAREVRLSVGVRF